jgi:hypothetical protein
MSKQAGRMSQSANDFLEPKAPTNVVATDVGTGRPYNNGAVTVSFSLPGDSPAATSYTVTSSPGGFTATGASSPLTVQGLLSSTAYTFTVTATNASGTSAASAASASVTATTVPATPSAPSASTPSAGTDSVSWSAPANGGKAITNYRWAASDGKAGDTASTSVSVGQEMGSAQTYTVYATNANGNSGTSGASGSVTTAFSFVPFGFAPFGFTPFGFTPFGFTPFGFTPFGFTPFGFTPFGFTPFGFTPFGFTPFGFTPFGFTPVKSIGADTLISSKVPEGLVLAHNLSVGDVLYSADISGLDLATDIPIAEYFANWSEENPVINTDIETTITALSAHVVDKVIVINGNKYSISHYILVKRDGISKFINVVDVLDTDLVYSPTFADWQPIIELRESEGKELVITINTEPYDIFFTDNALVHDSQPLDLNDPSVITDPSQTLASSLETLYQAWKLSQQENPVDPNNPPA